MNKMTTRATGAAAIAVTIAPGHAWQLHEIRVHLSAVGASGSLTATMDAGAGATYDAVIFSQDMTSVTNLLWQPELPVIFNASDELDIAWANAGGKTYGIEIIHSLI